MTKFFGIMAGLLGFISIFSTLTNPTKESIKIEIKPKLVKEETTIKISPNCKVFIDGKEATIKDLKSGMESEFTVENGIVIRIDVITKKE